jgi:signal recognition particle subunit SRP19
MAVLTILKYLKVCCCKMDRQRKVLWPVYIDGHKTRKQGRILAKKDSVTAPGIKEIVRAAAELGLDPSCEDEKMYPRGWWEQTGRALVQSDSTKRDTIRQIARKIKITRASQESKSQ